MFGDQPVIRVDAKKELVGDYSNSGREWHPKRKPTRTDVHDFPDPEMGKSIPAPSRPLSCPQLKLEGMNQFPWQVGGVGNGRSLDRAGEVP